MSTFDCQRLAKEGVRPIANNVPHEPFVTEAMVENAGRKSVGKKARPCGQIRHHFLEGMQSIDRDAEVAVGLSSEMTLNPRATQAVGGATRGLFVGLLQRHFRSRSFPS